jgi:hypothetical protein
LIGESGREGDFTQREFRLSHQLHRVFDSQSEDVRVRRLPDRFTERSGKVRAAESDDGRKRRHADWAADSCVDRFVDEANPRFVKVRRHFIKTTLPRRLATFKSDELSHCVDWAIDGIAGTRSSFAMAPTMLAIIAAMISRFMPARTVGRDR